LGSEISELSPWPGSQTSGGLGPDFGRVLGRNDNVLCVVGVMAAGESNAQLNTKHESPVAILVIANPEFGAGPSIRQDFQNWGLSDFTRYFGLGELFGGSFYFLGIGGVEQHFHNS
jgi:hypothetical protein